MYVYVYLLQDDYAYIYINVYILVLPQHNSHFQVVPLCPPVRQDLALAWDQQLPWTQQILDCQVPMKPGDLMDGRNPAPVDRWFIPLFISIYRVSTMQGGAGFRNHPQYFYGYFYSNNMGIDIFNGYRYRIFDGLVLFSHGTLQWIRIRIGFQTQHLMYSMHYRIGLKSIPDFRWIFQCNFWAVPVDCPEKKNNPLA